METVKIRPQREDTVRVMSQTFIRGDDNIKVTTVDVISQESNLVDVSFEASLEGYTIPQKEFIRGHRRKIGAMALNVPIEDVIGDF